MTKKGKKLLLLLFLPILVFSLINMLVITNNNNLEIKDESIIKMINENSDLNYYSTYRKFHEAEVKGKEDTNVKFDTVVSYMNRAYSEGINRIDEGAIKNVYYPCFTDVYEYWYKQSNFYNETCTNISLDRANEITSLSDEIVVAVDNSNKELAIEKIDNLISELKKDAKVIDDKNIYALNIEYEEKKEEVSKNCYLTYKQYVAAYNPDGDKQITYSNVAIEIKRLLDEGVKRYKNEGYTKNSYTPFSNSYGFWYETSGFERKTMAYISGSRVTAVELQFAKMKSAVRESKSVEDVQAQVDALFNMLEVDGKKLDDKLGYSSDGKSSNLAWATFIGCFTIILREGLEAILIVGAIAAYLIKTNNKKKTKAVYIGAGVAIIASVLLAVLLYSLSWTGVPQEIIEGVTALLAVAVLIYVSNWMISKAEADAWQNYISSKVSDSASKGKLFSLAFTSFLAVFREGAEVILFFQPLVSSAKEINNGYLAVFGGLFIGLAIVMLVFVLIRVFSIRIPLKPFFMITSIFMAFMSIVFLGAGIWELFIDGGIWPTGIISDLAWMAENDVLNFFGIYPTWLTIIPQIILTIITVVTFVLWIKKGNKKKENKESNSVENNDKEVISTSEESSISNTTEEKEDEN